MTNIIKSFYESMFGKLLAEKYSHGARIRIIQKGPYKELMYNNTVFSRIVKGQLLTGSYWDYFLPLPSLFENPKILVIGLGGGTIPYQLESFYKNASIDVIEIDDTIASMYKVFIGSALKSNIIIGDGIEYMGLHKGEYDIIILDAYIDDEMPTEFFSELMINNAYSCLKKNGILAANYTLTSLSNAKAKGFGALLEKRFKVYSLAMPAISGNIIIICSKSIPMNNFKGIGNMPKLKEGHGHIDKAYSNIKVISYEVI